MLPLGAASCVLHSLAYFPTSSRPCANGAGVGKKKWKNRKASTRLANCLTTAPAFSLTGKSSFYQPSDVHFLCRTDSRTCGFCLGPSLENLNHSFIFIFFFTLFITRSSAEPQKTVHLALCLEPVHGLLHRPRRGRYSYRLRCPCPL